MREGDLLKAGDGRTVRNEMEAMSALRYHDGPAPFAFRVRRGDVELSLDEPRDPPK